MARTPIVVGNWKLNKTVSEALELVTELKNQVASLRGVDIGVAPVFTALHPVARRLEDSNVFVSGQTCAVHDRGAWTGEVAASLLKDVGCTHAIVGHSERRQHFGEDSELVGTKARAALDAGLTAIVCVGETEAQRDAGSTEATVSAQLSGALASVSGDDLERLVIAYEPVWAIGTGRTATPEQAQEVHAHIRQKLAEQYGKASETIRIQYGGSVKPDNAESLMRQPDIDGALVGGASLQADSFAAIARAARLASGG